MATMLSVPTTLKMSALPPSSSPSSSQPKTPSPLRHSTSYTSAHRRSPSSGKPVLTPSHSFAGVSTPDTSARQTIYDIITPAFNFTLSLAYTLQLYFTRLVSWLAVHGYYATKSFLTTAYLTLTFIVLRAYFFVVFCGQGLVRAGREVYKRSEPARKRLFWEFMVWLLHPSPVLMVVMWPGWIVLVMAWVAWKLS